ncbi:hypothetical protein D9756_007935 [Leucocoprinus leucothites]|uniref:Nucleotidyl transferase AbiEii/AbiGii toxin family protein n=1 Tax=Leucocoprinus leucothites TaxID=201217 RepID=A0A8H5D4F6_9AGAR|nr:hypothetical protein D9756_007935 [Leucoagaricus leucothites]
MPSTSSIFQQQEGDACRWITAQEFREVEEGIRERGFPTETELHATYIDIRNALDYGNIDFAVVGGYAMNAYGIKRKTYDVDFYFNATDEHIFGVLRALPVIAIRNGLGTSTDSFRVHFVLSTGVVVGVDFHRVPIDLRLGSRKSVIVLDDKETRTLTSTGLVNSKLRRFHSRRKTGLPTLQDEEDIYLLITGLISVEDVHQLNRNFLAKEFLPACRLSSEQKEAIRDLICPEGIDD